MSQATGASQLTKFLDLAPQAIQKAGGVNEQSLHQLANLAMRLQLSAEELEAAAAQLGLTNSEVSQLVGDAGLAPETGGGNAAFKWVMALGCIAVFLGIGGGVAYVVLNQHKETPQAAQNTEKQNGDGTKGDGDKGKNNPNPPNPPKGGPENTPPQPGTPQLVKDGQLLALIATLQAQMPAEKAAFEALKYDVPAWHFDGWKYLLPRLGGPTTPKNSIKALLARSYAHEPAEETAQLIREHLLKMLPPQVPAVPDSTSVYDEAFWAVEIAVDALQEPGLSPGRRDKLQQGLQAALKLKGPMSPLPAVLRKECGAALSELFFDELTQAAKTAPDKAAKLEGSLSSQTLAYLGAHNGDLVGQLNKAIAAAKAPPAPPDANPKTNPETNPKPPDTPPSPPMDPRLEKLTNTAKSLLKESAPSASDPIKVLQKSVNFAYTATLAAALASKKEGKFDELSNSPPSLADYVAKIKPPEKPKPVEPPPPPNPPTDPPANPGGPGGPGGLPGGPGGLPGGPGGPGGLPGGPGGPGKLPGGPGGPPGGFPGGPPPMLPPPPGGPPGGAVGFGGGPGFPGGGAVGNIGNPPGGFMGVPPGGAVGNIGNPPGGFMGVPPGGGIAGNIGNPPGGFMGVPPGGAIGNPGNIAGNPGGFMGNPGNIGGNPGGFTGNPGGNPGGISGNPGGDPPTPAPKVNSPKVEAENLALALKMLRMSDPANRLKGIEYLAEGASVPDLAPNEAETLADYLLNVKNAQEFQAAAAGLPKLGRFKGLHLALADQLDEANVLPSRVETVVAGITGKQQPNLIKEKDWRKQYKVVLLKSVLSNATESLPEGDAVQLMLRDLYQKQAGLLGVGVPGEVAKTSDVLQLLIFDAVGKLEANPAATDATRKVLKGVPKQLTAIKYLVGSNDIQATVLLQRLWLDVLSEKLALEHPTRADQARALCLELDGLCRDQTNALSQMWLCDQYLLRMWLLYLDQPMPATAKN